MNRLIGFTTAASIVTFMLNLMFLPKTYDASTKALKGITELSQKIETLEFDVWIEKPEPRITKQRDMRVTGYVPTGNKTALGENVVVGRTAAVSRNCMDLLGEKVYIEGHGIRYVNDLTAQWVGEKFNICTIDLAVPSEKHAKQIGNEVREVIHIPINETN